MTFKQSSSTKKGLVITSVKPQQVLIIYPSHVIHAVAIGSGLLAFGVEHRLQNLLALIPTGCSFGGFKSHGYNCKCGRHSDDPEGGFLCCDAKYAIT